VLGRAAWAFAGPGSPTYALRQWRSTPVPAALAEVVRRGCTLVLGSAATRTAGTHAAPVYEIYKVGEDPHWVEALDLVGELAGIHGVLIPHFDNAEGGTHDTRYCYLGERRLAVMEADLPDTVGVLGVDEHTALLLDLGAGTADVAGTGTVTLPRRDGSRVFEAGTRLGLDDLAGLLRGDGEGAEVVARAGENRSAEPLTGREGNEAEAPGSREAPGTPAEGAPRVPGRRPGAPSPRCGPTRIAPATPLTQHSPPATSRAASLRSSAWSRRCTTGRPTPCRAPTAPTPGGCFARWWYCSASSPSRAPQTREPCSPRTSSSSSS
jgi:hypothetical protein